MVSGIYKLTCIRNNKAYIGKTEGKIEARVNQHLDGNCPGCRAIHNAIKKHGKENFVVEILEENAFPEVLSDLEKFYIAKFDTFHNGYNLTEGGETGHQSEETIRKRTDVLRANPPMKGKKHTPEARAKMSKSRTGKKHSKKWSDNISKGLMGHSVSEETKRKIGDANRGGKWSDEARKAQSERNSGEGNPMYGVRRYGEDSPNTSPEYVPARDYFHSLPPDMPMKEKRSHLHSKFTNLPPERVERWTLKWIRSPHLETGGDNPHYNPNHTASDTQSLPEKESAREFFFSLPTDMDIKEKRQLVRDNFPDVKASTIGCWVREWAPHETGKQDQVREQAHNLFLSLPSDMSIVEKRQYLQKNVEGVPRGIISRWVQQWTNRTGRHHPKHPDYEKAQTFFLSLPSDMKLNEKHNLFRKEFPHISKSSVSKWIKEWTGETMPTGAPSHPERPAIHQYFLSLPPDMPISEKRKLILEKFDDAAHRSLVNSWTRKWHIELTGSPPPVEKWYREPQNHWKKGKPAHNRRPEYDEAQEFFLSLSPMMPSKEKSKQLSVKYPHIPKGTISQWVSRWQSKPVS